LFQAGNLKTRSTQLIILLRRSVQHRDNSMRQGWLSCCSGRLNPTATCLVLNYYPGNKSLIIGTACCGIYPQETGVHTSGP